MRIPSGLTSLLLQSVLAIFLLTSNTLAIFADDAYVTDFHHALLGTPRFNATFFHAPVPNSKASLVYTLSQKNVLGAVRPRDGGIVWRQSLEPLGSSSSGKGAVALKTTENSDTVLALVRGKVTAWAAADGKLAWEYDSVVEGLGEVLDVEVPDMVDNGKRYGTKDAIVLVAGAASSTSGSRVRRLDGANGKVLWTYEDTSGDTPYRIAASATDIFLIAYHKKSTGIQFKITTLDPVTGQKVGDHNLSTESDVSSPADILYVGSNSQSHIIAWSDSIRRKLHINVLGTSKISTFDISISKGVLRGITFHTPTKNHAQPHFLVHYETDQGNSWATVYHIDLQTHDITKAHQIPSVKGKSVWSATTVDANVFFTRIHADEMALFASTSKDSLATWPVRPLNFFPGSSEATQLLHATSEVVARDTSTYSVRSAVVLSSGDWVQIRNGEIDWSRPESLAGVVKASWAPSPAHPALEEALKTETSTDPVSAYIHRLIRHIRDLSSLPSWLMQLPTFILQTLPTIAAKADITPAQKLYFGFDKLAFLVTDAGRVVGLEPGNFGRIAFNLPSIKLAVGEKLSATDASSVLAQLFALPRVSAYLLEATATGTVSTEVLLPEWEKQIARAVELAAPGRRRAPRSNVITYNVQLDGSSMTGTKGQETLWTFRPQPGEVVVGNAHAALADEPIASIGKVLASRDVLYKYLNPNAVLVTATNAAKSELTIYMLDSVSGNLLHSANHINVDVTRPVAAVVSENWFAYSFTSDDDAAVSKGYNLVIAEALTSLTPNDQGWYSSSNTTSPDSTQHSPPAVIASTFLIPYEISSMSVTQTAQGITTRHLLAALSSSSSSSGPIGPSSIVSIPRLALDPRRPSTRDPTRAEMEHEGLSRYAPFLDFAPQWFLSHNMELLGIEHIVAAPSLLESTSLVLAYGGLDVYGGRVSPSWAFDVLGSGFNKGVMSLTVLALIVGTVVVAPVVGRKGVDVLWKAPT